MSGSGREGPKVSARGDMSMHIVPCLWKAGNHRGYMDWLQSHRCRLEFQSRFIFVFGMETVIKRQPNRDVRIK